MKIEYRREIDGLRAIAVISVIVYHSEYKISGYQVLKGGFLGVDVFFVISGFLISSIILNEINATGRFCFRSFYVRRVRRLIPILLTVMLFSMPLAWALLLPEQFIDFSKSILASLLISSNFYWDRTLHVYGAESGYLKPFLHIWSLSVEEQFYMIFPMLMILTRCWVKWKVMATYSSLFLASLLFAQIATGTNYHTPEARSGFDATSSFLCYPLGFGSYWQGPC